MPSFNKVTLIGRLVRDAELTVTSSELNIAKFTIAVDRRTGAGKEKKADFFRCIAFRKTAEFAQNYCEKGRLVAVDGRVEINEYTDKDGNKRESTDIVVDNIELLDSKKDAQAAQTSTGSNANANADDSVDSDPFSDE